MILKGFKEKSNKKYINKCTKSRVLVSNNAVIKTIGVLVDSQQFSDLEWINQLAKSLKVNANNLKILSLFNNKKEGIALFGNTFSEKDLGWKGHLKSQTAKDFIAINFDLLINLYETDALALQLVTAATNAQFKVGIYNARQDINDLIIETKLVDKSIFKTELIKYLNILNKISNE
ncbi:DUF6913 domain-containing protein [Psychroserpens sp. NJDZ02]|uniref:DUF6913 domain-containing protein n=1 Tax=Psychroserpens sp. NJDZ02 TaxID=2570561 RepID=UPI0010A8B85F|nr:hypothetical protein [Psychroserpens sp. NJDZ02]QCE43418.1 hypothetical protein E9099_18985 [Psychroserpens sp. NJDZ02]